MKKIKMLDDKTIQKIAAGEVVERPASIVKELLENSLDAGAENIVIEIEDGGKSYIRVTDDGEGIREDELDLAFKRHSTSKLSTIEDLYRIKSLGFRGEALSSISNVSRMEVMTKTDGLLAGVRATIKEGEIIDKEIVGTPKGTTMIVKDLFYNLPVRKEFLKTKLIESNKVSDVVYKAALGNPKLSFRYIKDKEVILTTSKNNNLRNHIYAVLGKDFSKNLIEVEYEDEDINITGLISNNQLYRSNRSHQYLYINDRYIEDLSIAKNIENEYKSIIPLNRFPVFILFIEIDPSQIDVNIHPTKQEIKFSKQEEVLKKINSTIKTGLRSDITIPKAKIKRNTKKKSDDIPLLFDMPNSKDMVKENNLEESIVKIKDFRNTSELMDDKKNKIKNENNEELIKENSIKYNNNNIKETLNNLNPIGVIFGTYILAEDKINKKFYFIDQHAAHERVMYEKYLKEYREEEVNIQQLISPIIIELTNKEINNVKVNLNLLRKLGFDIDVFGSSSVIIRGVPIVFGNPNINDLFFDILDNLDMNINSSYDLRVEKIMKIACVNSIKSGDKLDDREILSLFNSLKHTEHPYSCPHGRPTMLSMSEKDIEKEFLRIM